MRAIFDLFRQTFKEWNEDKAPRLAAALAYYTAFSLAPVLVIALWIVDFFYAESGAGAELLLAEVGGLAGEQARALVAGMVTASQALGGDFISVVVGGGALIFGASGLFIHLVDSLNTIWEVAPRPNRGLLGVVKDRFLSFAMVLSIGFLLLVSLLISTLLAALGKWTTGLLLGSEALASALNFVVSFAVITVLFALIFKYVPDARIRWRDVWLGALVTALLFSLGKYAIGLYLGNSRAAEQFGAAGSLVVILLWVYYSAQIIFFGAEFTQVYANRYGEGVVPARGAVSLSEGDRRQQGIPHKAAPRIIEPLPRPVHSSPALTGSASPTPGQPPTLSPAPAGGSLALFASLVGALVAVLSGYLALLGSRSRER